MRGPSHCEKVSSVCLSLRMNFQPTVSERESVRPTDLHIRRGTTCSRHSLSVLVLGLNACASMMTTDARRRGLCVLCWQTAGRAPARGSWLDTSRLARLSVALTCARHSEREPRSQQHSQRAARLLSQASRATACAWGWRPQSTWGAFFGFVFSADGEAAAASLAASPALAAVVASAA